MCDNVLPVLSNIAKPEGSGDDVDVQLDVLKLFAELSVHCGDVENLENKIGKLFNKLVVSILKRIFLSDVIANEVMKKIPKNKRERKNRAIQQLVICILHKCHQNVLFLRNTCLFPRRMKTVKTKLLTTNRSYSSHT